MWIKNLVFKKDHPDRDSAITDFRADIINELTARYEEDPNQLSPEEVDFLTQDRVSDTGGGEVWLRFTFG
jgi:hypothetical protein